MPTSFDSYVSYTTLLLHNKNMQFSSTKKQYGTQHAYVNMLLFYGEREREYLPSTIFIPLSRYSELTSFRTTYMLPRIRAVAMPEPIRPPPITATLFTDLGLSPISVTFGTCQRSSFMKLKGDYVSMKNHKC